MTAATGKPKEGSSLPRDESLQVILTAQAKHREIRTGETFLGSKETTLGLRTKSFFASLFPEFQPDWRLSIYITYDLTLDPTE